MFYAVVLAIFFILFIRLTMEQFRWAVVLVAGLLPAYVIRFHLGPLPTTVLESLLLIVLAYWGFELWNSPRRGPRLQALTQSLFFKPGLLLLAAAALSIIWSADAFAALGIWRAYFLEPFLFYLLLVDQMKSKDDWRDLFIALGATTIALALFAAIQRLTGWWSPTWEWTQPGSRRVTGVFTSPNALGLFIVPVISVYTWFVARHPDNRHRWAIYVIGAGVLATVLAVSKGAMIAFAPVLLLALSQKFSRKQLAAGVGALILLILLSPARLSLQNLATFQTESGQSRLQLYKGAVELLKQHPVQGLGLASFGEKFEQVRPETYTEKLIYPHNLFLNFWAETGLIGLVAILWIIGLIAKTAWKLRARLDHPAWYFLLGLLPVLVHGLIDVSYFKNDLAVLTWLLLAGLALCYTNHNSYESELRASTGS